MQNAECKMQNEQRLIDAKARGCNGEVKIKTHFTKIIVEETAGGLYYSILYYDPRRKQYYNGYGSYSVETVLEWFAEYFETVEAPAIDAVPTVDAVEVVHGRWEYWAGGLPRCPVCGYEYTDYLECKNYCGNCGANMDGGNEDV